MEWWMVLILFIGSLLLVMSIGLPIGFSFFLVNFAFVIIAFGLEKGSSQIILSTYESVAKFTMTPVPLFILMGDVLTRSGIVGLALESMSRFLGKLPGRLSLLSLGAGALFASLSGSGMANTAVLGSTMIPEMRNYKYHKTMIFGPIMAAAALAIVIPPSTLTVLLGGIAKIPVGPLLIGGIVPGLMMVVSYMIYVVVRCKLNPELAPPYDTGKFTFSEKMQSAVRYILPLSFIIFMVMGMIFLGVATPTEASALGALGSYTLAFCYRRMNKQVFLDSLNSAVRNTGIIMFIIASSAAFSQLLALTGATREIVRLVTVFHLTPMAVLLLMLLVKLILGMFLEQIPIMMVTLPIFMPLVIQMGFDPIWFGIIFLITIEIGTISPPFGMILFVMKGVAPKDTKMMDIYRSAIPFVLINFLIVALLILIPEICTWLPHLMYK